jgi:hypothetical protein
VRFVSAYNGGSAIDISKFVSITKLIFLGYRQREHAYVYSTMLLDGRIFFLRASRLGRKIRMSKSATANAVTFTHLKSCRLHACQTSFTDRQEIDPIATVLVASSGLCVSTARPTS